MMYPDACITLMAALILMWYECGENLPVFCYRIGCGALVKVTSRAFPRAAEPPVLTAARKNLECSIPSSTSFDRFTIQKVSDN